MQISGKVLVLSKLDPCQIHIKLTRIKSTWICFTLRPHINVLPESDLNYIQLTADPDTLLTR